MGSNGSGDHHVPVAVYPAKLSVGKDKNIIVSSDFSHSSSACELTQIQPKNIFKMDNYSSLRHFLPSVYSVVDLASYSGAYPG
jgi:hypothetical protein